LLSHLLVNDVSHQSIFAYIEMIYRLGKKKKILVFPVACQIKI